MNDSHVWFYWASTFLIPWAILYYLNPDYRSIMLKVSVLTMLFGLSEPLFVPEYWSPPTLFNLAQRTGFDIESLIFCFGIGGVGAVLYNVITKKTLSEVSLQQHHSSAHRYHLLALASPLIIFPILVIFTDWNNIYPSIIAMFIGGVANSWCRHDLALKSLIGAGLFLLYYMVFFLLLEWSAPGYVERVWNLPELSGILILGIPLEELLFASSFGFYWTGLYEHIRWKKT